MESTATLTRSADLTPWVYGDAFPDSDMLAVVAAMFPSPTRSQSIGWQNSRDAIAPAAPRVVGAPTLEGVLNARLKGVKLDPSTAVESATAYREGSWPELLIAPGMVRLRRRDRSSADRARDREVLDRHRDMTAPDQPQRVGVAFHDEARARFEAWADRQPMALIDWDAWTDDIPAIRKRGSIVKWSRRSQMRLIQAVLQLDLAPLVRGKRSPVMVTLTLPDQWLELAPDAETLAAKFDDFRRRFEHKWGKARWIWKREFQRRGAPHFHLWMVPPVDALDEWAADLRRMWVAALGVTNSRDRALALQHSVDVSRADGMKARDPRRLAFYFLKESGAAGRKAYQNEPPAQWAGTGGVGRYWGVRGISRAVVSIDIDPDDFEALYDRVAELRALATGWHRAGDGDLVNIRTGAIMDDPMAGWVAVESGADFGVELAALLLERPPR